MGAFRSGNNVTTAADADDRITLDTATGNLYYDANGSGAGAAVQIAILQGSNLGTVAAADFLVIT